MALDISGSDYFLWEHDSAGADGEGQFSFTADLYHISDLARVVLLDGDGNPLLDRFGRAGRSRHHHQALPVATITVVTMESASDADWRSAVFAAVQNALTGVTLSASDPVSLYRGQPLLVPR